MSGGQESNYAASAQQKHLLDSLCFYIVTNLLTIKEQLKFCKCLIQESPTQGKREGIGTSNATTSQVTSRARMSRVAMLKFCEGMNMYPVKHVEMPTRIA